MQKKKNLSRMLLAAAISGLLVFSAVLLLSGSSAASPWNRGDGLGMVEPGMAPLDRMKKALDLTDEQQEKIRMAFDRTKAPRDQVDARREALRKEMRADYPDERLIREKAEDLGRAIGDMSVAAVETRQAIQDNLTPEQLEKWNHIKAEGRLRIMERLRRGLDAASSLDPVDVVGEFRTRADITDEQAGALEQILGENISRLKQIATEVENSEDPEELAGVRRDMKELRKSTLRRVRGLLNREQAGILREMVMSRLKGSVPESRKYSEPSLN